MRRRRFLRQTGATAISIATVSSVADRARAAQRQTPLVSTRNHFEDPWFGGISLTDGHTPTDYDPSGDVPGIDTGCVNELTIYVHGWNVDEAGAIENANEALTNLQAAGYAGSVVGFTWDSDIGGLNSWYDAQEVAKQNGPKLANVALDFKLNCPSSTLRFVSHSLGAQVVLSTLRTLATWTAWTDRNYMLRTLHMLGAAVANEAPTTRWPNTHNAIATQTTSTFNYYNYEDDVLSTYFGPAQQNQALGEDGAENTAVPENYLDYNVTDQVGDDHSGYMNVLGDEILNHMV